MENLLLELVLFLVYFCTVSCFLYSNKASQASASQSHKPIEQQVRAMLSEIDASGDNVIQEKEDFSEKVNTLINYLIPQLSLRKARPVAKALNIRQKVNGKGVTAASLRAQIKHRLEEQPVQIPVVYNLLQLPMPFDFDTIASELIPDYPKVL